MQNKKEIRHFSRENISNRPIILWSGGLYGEIAYRVITDLWNGKIEAVVDKIFQSLVVCRKSDSF